MDINKVKLLSSIRNELELCYYSEVTVESEDKKERLINDIINTSLNVIEEEINNYEHKKTS